MCFNNAATGIPSSLKVSPVGYILIVDILTLENIYIDKDNLENISININKDLAILDNIDMDKTGLENIDINMDFLENIDMDFLENIDIEKEILQ